MKNHLFKLLALLLLLCGAAQAQDGFESVRCGSDIPRALAGKRMSDEPVVKIEGRHIALGLIDLGGDEISDRLNSTSWSICGNEYMLLSDTRGIIHDVLAIPSHSRTSPEFAGGICQANGRQVAGTIVAVLDNRAAGSGGNFSHYSPQDRTLLPAISAWKIDEKLAKFVALSSHGLSCPRGGIITADGGL
ncbi:MAG TPA: hypothetical protein VNX86_08875 [Rhizomicrobium sp.]|jgi:hypothetical protein|nr:hypothetical protein [Rhizomicrobium sp.]